MQRIDFGVFVKSSFCGIYRSREPDGILLDGVGGLAAVEAVDILKRLMSHRGLACVR